jgi:hypothetical protein
VKICYETMSNKLHSLRPDIRGIVLCRQYVRLVENPVLITYLINELNVIFMKEDTYYINMEMEMLDFWQWL